MRRIQQADISAGVFLVLALLASSHAVVYNNLLGARVNPLGALEQLKVEYRYKYLDSAHPLLEPAAIAIGSITNLTPAYVRMGPIVEWTPLAVLNLSVAFEGLGYFGSFHNVLSRPTPFADISDAARSAATDQYATYGTVTTLGALLQGKVGPVALRSQLNVMYNSLRLRRGDTVWYDALSDMLVPGSGFHLIDETDLLYISAFGLIAGARYTVAHPFTGGPGTQQRVGPLLVYQFFDRPGALFNKPCVIAMAQWYAQHPYRVGPAPQFIVAFSFQGEIPLRKE